MSIHAQPLRQLPEGSMYQLMFKSHPDPVFILDLDGHFIDVNVACTKLLGYSADEFRQMHPASILKSDSADLLEQGFQTIAEGQPFTAEFCVVRKDGSELDLLVTNTPVLLNEQIAGVFGIAKDISEQKAAEHMYRVGKERYESLKKYHPHGICSYNLNGEVIGANPAFERLSGYSLNELKQLRPETAFRFDESSEELRDIYLSTRHVTGVEAKFKHRDGHTVDVRVTTVPIVIEGNHFGNYVITEDISEEKRVKQVLVETQELFRVISENTKDIITYSDANGVLLYVSPSSRQLGYEPSELIGRQVNAFYHPGDHDYLEELGRRIRAGEDIDRFTCRILSKSGSFRWYETTMEILRDEAGQVIYTIGAGRDITEHMELQETLEHAVQLAGLGHWDWNLEANTIHYSNQGYETLGEEPVEGGFSFEWFLSRVHPEDVELMEHSIRSAIETGNPYDRVYRIIRSDGVTRYVHAQGEVLFDENGKAQRMIGTTHDITNRVLLEQQLRKSEERYRRLVENSVSLIGVVEDGKWAFINRSGLHMLGAEHFEDLIGNPAVNFIHPDDTVAFKGMVQSALRDKPAQAADQQWMRLDGSTFFAEITVIPFSDSAVQLIIRDITDKRRTDERLLQAEKLAAVGQLAAGVAHEIRNPLTALKGFTQMLQQLPKSPQHHYFDIMRGELERIDLILSEMLVLAKPQPALFQPQRMELLLRDVITLFGNQAVMRGISIEAELETNTPLVECDPNQLKQVFLNILKNGIEAMSSGGRLEIMAHSRDGMVFLEFTDDGPGIPADKLSRLGEPFFTTKATGTGLGLMICQKIVHAHNGSIQYVSTVGKGTTVQVRLPAVSTTKQAHSNE